MPNKNKQTPVPQSLWEAVFSAVWPLNNLKKKVGLLVVLIAFVSFSVWATIPEAKKVAFIDFIAARITNRIQSTQKLAPKEVTPPSKAPTTFDKDKFKGQPLVPIEAEKSRQLKQNPESDIKQGVGKQQFDIIGGTAEERNSIAKYLDDIKVKAASINIVKSERDSSRNVFIQVTFQDNIMFTDSFNTPLDNAANLIISEIDIKRRKR